MKIISGKFIFASLIFFLITGFVVNNFLYEKNYFNEKNMLKNVSAKEDKIIGVQIKQQNKKGDKFLIVADTLQEIESIEKRLF